MGKARKKHPKHIGVSRPRGTGDRPMVPEDIIPAPLSYLIAPANHRRPESHFWILWGERAELFHAEINASRRKSDIRRRWRTRKRKSLPTHQQAGEMPAGAPSGEGE